jgi:hypothetical protein
MKLTLLTMLAATLLACSGGDDGGDDDGGDGDNAAQVAACTIQEGCREMHLPSTGNPTPFEEACVDVGGVTSDTCEALPFAGCCAVSDGDAKTCYYGEPYASSDVQVLSQACASAGGEWQM